MESEKLIFEYWISSRTAIELHTLYIGYKKVLNGLPHLIPHLLESIYSEDKTVKMRRSVECAVLSAAHPCCNHPNGLKMTN